MADSLIETRERIQTIQSTGKITKAMKLVASVKFQKWRKIHEQNIPYAKKTKELMIKALENVDFRKSDLDDYFKSFGNEKTLYVVVTSSLGLCGSYNINLYKLFDSVLNEKDDILVIGSKGLGHYQERENKLYTDYVNLFDGFNYQRAKTFRHYLFRLYRESKEYKEIKIVYTAYKNSMTFVPSIATFVPVDKDVLLEKHEDKNPYPPLFDPSNATMAKELLPHYLDSQLYALLIESQLSEQASRRNAMETATDNAQSILDELSISYNKARQALITQEITEVVSGYKATADEE